MNNSGSDSREIRRYFRSISSAKFDLVGIFSGLSSYLFSQVGGGMLMKEIGIGGTGED